MSYNNYSKKNVKKFCKICFDAKKTEAIYTSHYVRETPDASSKIVCPTLLAQECRFCNKNGHTIKYCPVIKKKEQKEKQEHYATHKTHIQDKKFIPKKSTNSFECLTEGRDGLTYGSVVLTKYKKKDDINHFPELTKMPTNNTTTLNYANAIKKEPKVCLEDEEVPIIYDLVELKANAMPNATNNNKVAPWISSYETTEIKKISWADLDTDTEDEDTYEYEEPEYNNYDSVSVCI